MTVRRRSLVQKSSLPLNIKPVHRYSAVDCRRSDDALFRIGGSPFAASIPIQKVRAVSCFTHFIESRTAKQ